MKKKDRRLAPRPAVGDVVTVHGVKAKVFRIHPFGTIDVVTLDGKRAWRITGLAF